MKLHQALLSGAAALLAILTSNPAKAAPFANGSFEQPGVTSGTEQALPDGSTAIAGWTVGASGATYDAGTGFSAAQNDSNTRPWQYGYRDTLPPSSFTLLPQATVLGEMDFWSVGGGIPSLGHNRSSSPASAGFDWTLQPNQLLLHPSSGSAYYCVLRWTAPADGTYAIHAAWSGLGGNSTVDVHVLVDGDPKDNRTLSGQGATTTYDSTVPFTLVAGKTIEFVVGSGDGNATGDSTGLYATITAQSASGPGMVYVKDDTAHAAQAVNGAHLVSFGRSGGSGGTLSQTFDTVPGTTYTVNYRLTTEGTTDDGQTMSVAAFDGATSLAVANSNIPFTQGQWSFGTPLTFTATSTSTRLVFTDTTPTLSGATGSWALDDVTLSVTVPGSANVWLAGAAPGTTARNTDDTTTAAPVEAPIAVTPGQDVTFGVSGGVIHNSSFWPGSPGPDGDTAATHLAENSIAELKAPIDSLVGVFLDANTPSGSPAAYLDFTVATNRDLALLEPGLGQPFFIGDGLTSTNGVQRVRIPAGATRLFLGGLDEYDNAGNGGSFDVIAKVIAPLPQLTEFSDFQITTGNFGEDWTFSITQTPENAARTLVVQSRLGGSGPWTTLPGGGLMTLSAGVWSLTTAEIPLGDGRQFRVLATADGFAATGFEFATPFNVIHPAGPILYTRNNGTGRDLMVMQPDGEAKIALTDGSLNVQRCALSPDGKKAAFTTTDGKLFVRRFGGSGASAPVEILAGAPISLNAFSTPAWSPDGHYLAFASFTNLHVIQAVDDNDAIAEFDGATNPVIEVATTFDSAPALAWSPDGTYLANTEGSTISAFQILDEDGDITPTDATNTSFPLTLTSEFATQKVSLAWSPDGQQIAFVQKLPADGSTDIALLTVRDTSGVVTPESATNQRTLLAISGPQTVSWSPDGSLLTFESMLNGSTSFIETIRPELNGPSNPETVLTTPATDGAAFQPTFKQPVGGFQPAPFIAFEAATVSGNEEDAQIVVKVKRTGDATGTDSVDFIVTADPDPDGNSEEGADFTITTGPLVFAAGETEKQIVITPIDDALAEGDGIIEIELLTPDVAELGTIAKTTVTMHDGESAGLPFVAQASELKVFIDNKAKKKGKGAFDAKWRFEARQGGDNSQPGLRMLIQYSTTPEDEQSWELIPNPAVSRPSEGSPRWTLETDDMIPGTGVFFRTITAANVRQPNPGPVVGPFTITGSGVSLRVVAFPTGDPTPTYDKKGVPSYSTFAEDEITYLLVFQNRGPAINFEVNCSVPEGSHLRTTNFDPENPIYDATPGIMTVSTRGEVSAVKWNAGLTTGSRGSVFFKVVVDDDVRSGHSLTGKANLLTAVAPRLTIKKPMPIVKVVVPFLLEPTASKQNSLNGDTSVAGGDTITYNLAYRNETGSDQTNVKASFATPGSASLVFKDTAPRDGKDDDFGFEVPGGLEPVWNLGTVPAGATGNLTFKMIVSNGLKPGGSIPGPKFTLTAANLRKPLKGNFVDFTKQSPLYVTASRFGSGPVRPGEVIGYIVRVENQGATKLTNVVAKFTVPAGANFEQAGRGGTYDPEFHEVTWNLAEIAGNSVEQFGVFARLKYDYDLGTQIITGGDGSGFKGFNAAAQIAGYQASAKDTSGNMLQDTGDAVSVDVSTDTVADRPQIGIFTEAVADGEVDVPFIGRIPGLVPPEVAPNANPPLTGEITVNVRFHNFGNVAARNVRIHGHRFANTNFVNDSFGLTSMNPETTLETDERLGTYDLVYGTLDPNEVVLMSYKVKVPTGRRFGFLRQEGATLKSDDLFHTVEDSPEALDVDIVPPVEYEIHVVHEEPRIKEGDVVSYYIDYANKGIIASRAQIEVPLPNGVEYFGGAFLTSPTNRTPRTNLDTDERLPAIAAGTGGPGADHKWGTRDDDKPPVVVFDLGTLAAGEAGMVRLDIRLASPLHPKITPYKTNILLAATLKGQFGTASGTGAQPERAAASGTQNAPTNTTLDVLPVEKAKPPRLYIGRVAPMSVERTEGKLIAYTIHYGNTADFDPADQQPQLQDAQGVEIAMQIPFGTEFYAAYPGSYVKPNGSLDVKVENPKPRLSGRTVIWPIGLLPRNSGGAVTLVVSLNRAGLDLCAVEDQSCVIRASNATSRAAGKMATHVRSGNFFASAWESLGCFLKAIGSSLTPQVRDQMKDDAKQFNANSMLFTMSGADSITFKNGAFIVPIGQGRIVAGGGGNIVAAGGGNIVAGGGGNIVAGGGGNVLSHNGNAIVAAGGGNIVAAGGGNIVAGGGGNIVAGGGGNITITGLSNGSSLTAVAIVSGMIGQDAASFNQPNPFLLGIGGNLNQGHGGNLIALEGVNKGRLVGLDGASFSAGLALARSAGVVQGPGSTLIPGPGSFAAAGLNKPSLDTGAGMTAGGKGQIVAAGGGNLTNTNGPGLIGEDAAGIVAAGGGNIVAGGGMN